MLLLNRNKLLLDKVDMDEAMRPDNRTKRLEYQATHHAPNICHYLSLTLPNLT